MIVIIKIFFLAVTPVKMQRDDMLENVSKSTLISRKRTCDSDPVNNIQAKKAFTFIPSLMQKSAICVLNELYRGLEYKFSVQNGPGNSPIFTTTVDINGVRYIGRGKNKKLAKHNAAEAALRFVHL